DAHFQPVVVAPQFVLAPKAGAARLFHLGVRYGRLPSEQHLQGRAHTFGDGRNHRGSPSRCVSIPADRHRSATHTAVAIKLMTARGSNTFHPKLINRSYRTRGKLARSQINLKRSTAALPAKLTKGGKNWGPCHPPK